MFDIISECLSVFSIWTQHFKPRGLNEKELQQSLCSSDFLTKIKDLHEFSATYVFLV